MQISKTFLTLCVVVTGVLPMRVYGADTDAQAKAREALEKELYGTPAQQPLGTNATVPMLDDKARDAIRQKMNELQSQPPATAQEPAPTPPKVKPKKRPAPAPL